MHAIISCKLLPARTQPQPAKTPWSAVADAVLSLLATVALGLLAFHWQASPDPTERLLAMLAVLTAIPGMLFLFVAAGEVISCSLMSNRLKHGPCGVGELGR
jgi:hypothetical protein